MIRTLRGWAAGAVLALGITAGGCAGGGLQDVMNGGRPGGNYAGEIRGEVRDVDARSIDVRTENGRMQQVRIDGRTSVQYDGRRYSPGALRAGDRVVMRVNRDSRGELYTQAIAVRSRPGNNDRVVDRRTGQRVGERNRPRGSDRARGRDDRRRDDDRRDDRRYENARSVEGRVARLDARNGRFLLRDTGHGNVWVTLPRNSRGEMRSRVARLREGQHVRLQGRFLSGDRFEVEGFR